MANDHYISRFLTRPWEEPKRVLRFYDFDQRKVDAAPSKRLFAERDINERATEEFINEYFEKPLAQMQARLVKATSAEEASKAVSATEYSCYAAQFWLQIKRVQDAQSRADRSRLDELAAKGKGFLDGLAAVIHEGYDMQFVAVGGRDRLYFPDTGMFSVPVAGEPPVLCQPLTPRVFVTFLDRTRHTQKAKDALVEKSFIAMCSAGTDRVRRVVLPNDVEAMSPEEFDHIRSIVHRKFDLHAEIANVLEIDGWLLKRLPSAPPTR